MKLVIAVFILFQTIMLVSQENSEPRILCEGSKPTFSPDGHFIAYEYKQNIWTYNLMTNEKKQVSSLTWDFNPKWSPDGEKIIFQSYGDSLDYKNKRRFAIWIVNKDGSDQHKFIEEHNDGDQNPYWSPNDKNIIWTHGKRLWISDTSGQNAKPLNFNPSINWEYIVDWDKVNNTVMYLRCDDYKSSPNYYVCFSDISSRNFNIIYPKIFTEHAIFTKGKEGVLFISSHNDNSNTTNNKTYYLSKYLFDEKKTEENVYEIIIKNGNYLDYFDISSDYRKVVYDDKGPNTDPKIYMINIK